jgi:hypothetical protein
MTDDMDVRSFFSTPKTMTTKDDSYYFHQTPVALAQDILTKHDGLFADGDVLYEPFKGEGAFYNHFPVRCTKKWAEIEEGVDFREVEDYDWVITNPPFKLGDRMTGHNAFTDILLHFTGKARKGILFLASASCFLSLTPRRQAILKATGWGITHLTMCNVKKWSGRYFIIVFQPNTTSLMDCLEKSY